MNLTEHFTLAELTRSDYAVRHGLDNMPDGEVLGNLHLLAAGLERVRQVLGKPIHILSGYRCIEVNAGVNGAPDSAHLDGLAADIVVPGMTPLEVCRQIIAHPEVGFAKLIYEGTWTHISFPAEDHEPERMVLTAHFNNGKATYSKGLA